MLSHQTTNETICYLIILPVVGIFPTNKFHLITKKLDLTEAVSGSKVRRNDAGEVKHVCVWRAGAKGCETGE